MSDYWGWVEVSEGFEPGLYALQSRPQLGTIPVSVGIATFHTEVSTISGAFNTSINSIDFPITGYNSGFPVHGDGLGNWGKNKELLVWLYDDQVATEDVYVAICDTSSRPVPDPPTPLPFTEDLFYFPITQAGYTAPRMVRVVPTDNSLISFLAAPIGFAAQHRLLFIPSTGSPSITDTILAGDLHGGGVDISYYAFSPDGRYLCAVVDGQLVIQNRATSAIVLDVSESTTSGYQFTDDGTMLFYVKGGVLYIRRESAGWAVDETVGEEGTYPCGGSTNDFYWVIPRLSPDMNTWLNVFSATCGGPFDLSYRSYLKFKDDSFVPVATDNASAFASGLFMGEFSNDSRWYIGGDGNINGQSRVIVGPGPDDWELFTQGDSITGAYQMRSFQAF